MHNDRLPPPPNDLPRGEELRKLIQEAWKIQYGLSGAAKDWLVAAYRLRMSRGARGGARQDPLALRAKDLPRWHRWLAESLRSRYHHLGPVEAFSSATREAWYERCFRKAAEERELRERRQRTIDALPAWLRKNAPDAVEILLARGDEAPLIAWLQRHARINASSAGEALAALEARCLYRRAAKSATSLPDVYARSGRREERFHAASRMREALQSLRRVAPLHWHHWPTWQRYARLEALRDAARSLPYSSEEIGRELRELATIIKNASHVRRQRAAVAQITDPLFAPDRRVARAMAATNMRAERTKAAARAERARWLAAIAEHAGHAPRGARFGIEIEVSSLDGRPELPAGWAYVRDGSLPAGGIEIVSPPLTLAQMRKQTAIVLRTLREHKAGASHKCGVHLHASWPKMTTTLSTVVRAATAAHAEYPVLAHRKQFCHALPAEVVNAPSSAVLAEYYRVLGGSMTDGKYAQCRYRAVNLHSIAVHGTVEFRWFNGAIKTETVLGYIATVAGIVSLAHRGGLQCAA